MKILERNKMAFWYQLYDRKEIVEDEYGNETGGSRLIYKPAVKLRANVSSATGTAQIEQLQKLLMTLSFQSAKI